MEKERINMDFKGSQEIDLLREFKSVAVRQGKKIRQFVLEAFREKVANEKGNKK